MKYSYKCKCGIEKTIDAKPFQPPTSVKCECGDQMEKVIIPPKYLVKFKNRTNKRNV